MLPIVSQSPANGYVAASPFAARLRVCGRARPASSAPIYPMNGAGIPLSASSPASAAVAGDAKRSASQFSGRSGSSNRGGGTGAGALQPVAEHEFFNLYLGEGVQKTDDLRDSDLVDADGASMITDASGRSNQRSAAGAGPRPYMSEEDAGSLSIVAALRKFFLDSPHTFFHEQQLKEFTRDGTMTVDYPNLCTTIVVDQFPESLHESPLTLLNVMAMAFHQALKMRNAPFNHDRVTVRMRNYGPITGLRALKSNFVDKFVSIKGNVVRVSSIRPLVKEMVFVCSKCGNKIRRAFIDGKYNPPGACENKCKNKQLDPDQSTAVTIDYQKIRIQEIVSNEQIDQGRIPRTIECELTGDLVDCCIPGDVLIATGVVKARKTDAVKGPANKARNKSLFVLYLDVNYVSKNRQEGDEHNPESAGGKYEAEFSEKDLEAIKKIRGENMNMFRYLVHSLCPPIFGHEMVKAGLLLSLLGGNPRHVGDRSKLAVRCDPHVLVVGDPGLGKSQLLRAIAKVSPRGVYVCGNTTTTTGLTVTMVREGGSGEYALEAGALVLADQGCCCIDEFDKMASEHNALLEAMEQQSISIAKGGIVCTLAARTCVIAAANPVGGHYNRAKTVAENLKLNPALLSRFDIVFILLDSPDQTRDQLLSEHVIALHSHAARKSSPRSTTSASQRSNQEKDPEVLSTPSEWKAQAPLSERLRMAPDDAAEFDPLPSFLLRKYIAYAKKFVKPIMSLEAKKVLQSFYLELREKHQSADGGTPITTRQLESMIRLAEARCKLELTSRLVTREHAMDVVEIMKESLYDLFADDHGHIDFRRTTGMSKAKQTQAFVKILQKKAAQKSDATFTMNELYKIAQDSKIGVVDHFEQFIDSLNTANFLLSRGNKRFTLQTSEYG